MLVLAADDIGLTGLWFEGGKYYAEGLDLEHEEKWLPVFDTAKKSPPAADRGSDMLPLRRNAIIAFCHMAKKGSDNKALIKKIPATKVSGKEGFR